MRKLALVALPVALALWGAAPASPHNAGYVITGNGSCQEVGSNKEAPLVPEQNPNRNSTTGQLDLIPGPGDQYGARYAADQGNSAVQRPFSSTISCPPGT
jgi:hypothetical protein